MFVPRREWNTINFLTHILFGFYYIAKMALMIPDKRINYKDLDVQSEYTCFGRIVLNHKPNWL
jgi:hypothetical protein